jgi:MFS family permease
MGIYSSAQFAGAFAGGTIGGLLLSTGDMTYLLYFNVLACVIWFVGSLRLKKMGNLSSRVFHLRDNQDLSANEVADALLSLDGVLEVVFVDGDKIAYLKIDKDRLDESALAALQQGSRASAEHKQLESTVG